MHPDLIAINIRKSAFNNWRICPKLFEYMWVKDGRVQTMPVHESTSGVEAQYGTLFHSSAEQFFREAPQQSLRRCKTVDEVLEALEGFKVGHPIVGPWFENFKYFEALRWEDLYKRTKGDVDKVLMYWLPVMMELEIVEEKLLGVTMHIDRVSRIKRHVLMNVEYKTSKSWRVSDLRLESAFYNVGLNISQIFTDPTQYYAVYNPQLALSMLEEINDRLIRRLIKELTLCKEAVKYHDYPYKPSFFCKFCPRLEKCLDEEFGGVEARDGLQVRVST